MRLHWLLQGGGDGLHGQSWQFVITSTVRGRCIRRPPPSLTRERMAVVFALSTPAMIFYLPMKRTTIRLDNESRRKAQELAEADGRTVSALIRWLISQAHAAMQEAAS